MNEADRAFAELTHEIAAIVTEYVAAKIAREGEADAASWSEAGIGLVGAGWTLAKQAGVPGSDFAALLRKAANSIDATSLD